MFRCFQLVRGSGRGRSVCSCPRNLPSTLRCDSGARNVSRTSPPDVWDKSTLGPDTCAVSPFPAGSREPAWSERAQLLAQPAPGVTVRFGGRRHGRSLSIRRTLFYNVAKPRTEDVLEGSRNLRSRGASHRGSNHFARLGDVPRHLFWRTSQQVARHLNFSEQAML